MLYIPDVFKPDQWALSIYSVSLNEFIVYESFADSFVFEVIADILYFDHDYLSVEQVIADSQRGIDQWTFGDKVVTLKD